MFQSNIFASCDEDCEVTKSCKEYIECRVAQLECIAACRQKEAWEISARAAEETIAATEKMAQVFESSIKISEKIVALLDKIIAKISEEEPANQQEKEEK